MARFHQFVARVDSPLNLSNMAVGQYFLPLGTLQIYELHVWNMLGQKTVTMCKFCVLSRKIQKYMYVFRPSLGVG